MIEGEKHLIDWGVKNIARDKNTLALKKTSEMLEFYKPSILALPEYSSNHRRASCASDFIKQAINLGRQHKLIVAQFSAHEIKSAYFESGEGTKDMLARLIAEQFPEELALRLPAKRRAWSGVDYRTSIFDAVVLAKMPKLQNQRITLPVFPITP